MNPFYFNDTMAYVLDKTFTQEDITKEGYLWRAEKVKVDIPQNAQTVQLHELSSYESKNSEGKYMIDPSILKKVIQDSEGNSYRIIQDEYDFLMKYSLPLPRLHWMDRMRK